jgi:hypothetical protein
MLGHTIPSRDDHRQNLCLPFRRLLPIGTEPLQLYGQHFSVSAHSTGYPTMLHLACRTMAKFGAKWCVATQLELDFFAVTVAFIYHFEVTSIVVNAIRSSLLPVVVPIGCRFARVVVIFVTSLPLRTTHLRSFAVSAHIQILDMPMKMRLGKCALN